MIDGGNLLLSMNFIKGSYHQLDYILKEINHLTEPISV